MATKQAVSGRSLERELRRLTGTWEAIRFQAIELGGERGAMMVSIIRARSIPNYRKLYLARLQEAGIDVDAALRTVAQPNTCYGLRMVINKIYQWLVEDICLELIKTGECAKEGCTYTHELG